MMRKMIVMLFLFIFFSLTSSAAAEGQSSFKISIGKYNINGVIKEDVAPYIKNGRTYLPLRYTAYSLGIGDNSIYWDQETKTAFLSKGDEIVAVKLGKYFLHVGNRTIPIDVPAEIHKGRTMLPIRAIAEALQCEVEWDQTNQLATVKIEN